MKPMTAIIALSLVASGAAACGGGDHTVTEDTRDPVEVTVVPVAAVDTAERLEAGGVVAAREAATLSARIVATIATVRVTAGDRVRAGDVLVTLDARDATDRTQQMRAGAAAAEKALAQARTEQAGAEADYRLAAAWHQRVTALHARHSATDQERDEANARLAAATARMASVAAAIEVADANLTSARSAVDVATATESYSTVRAPFNGLITERLVDPGNLAAPGVPLLRIESEGARQVVARVDEARAAFIHPGDRVIVDLDQPLDCVVAEVARAIGADQRAFTVKVNVPDTLTARSGAFARVIFQGAPRKALVVPAESIHRQGQVSSVYVVQDGTARLRLIQTGSSSPAGVEVLAGLDAGESIVTAPAAGIGDGTRVTVVAALKATGERR